MTRVAVPVALAAMLALSVYRVMAGPRWLNRDAPLVETPEPVTPSPMDPARHVLLVVLDGARADSPALVPALKAFTARSTLVADLPTISAAQYVALLSGVPPEDSGRRSNDSITPTGLDSVGAVVRRAGGKTAAFSDCVEWWPQLFPDAFDVHGPVTHPLGLGAFNFTVVHLCAFDSAGHRSGAASDDYRVQAAASVERDVKALLAEWQELGPVVVTADHGHRDAGGHGGDEPEVRTTFALFRGAPAAPAAEGRSIDLAATLSGLLGVPAPASSEGTSLFGNAARPTVHWRDPGASVFLERLLRALAVLLGGALVLLLARRQPLGLAAGALTVLAVASVYLALYPLSISGHRDYARLVIHTALLGAACGTLFAAVPALRALRRGGRTAGMSFALGAAAAAGLLAVPSNIVYGVASPRLLIGPAWALALPSVANAAWAGSLLPLTLVALAAAVTSDRSAS
jgi:hypothetical protein